MYATRIFYTSLWVPGRRWNLETTTSSSEGLVAAIRSISEQVGIEAALLAGNNPNYAKEGEARIISAEYEPPGTRPPCNVGLNCPGKGDEWMDTSGSFMPKKKQLADEVSVSTFQRSSEVLIQTLEVQQLEYIDYAQVAEHRVTAARLRRNSEQQRGPSCPVCSG